MHDFTGTVDHQPDLAVITMVGEMDLVTVPAVEKAALLVPLGAKTLHLEMPGVSFMDSSGLTCCCARAAACTQKPDTWSSPVFKSSRPACCA
ncbi:STAS domain-containing protein [Streptomyces flavidovirens]|uniref:STAS domain-containing protein n=1 Tax=Streptomyces flavidovirens TaxID=67298 RepID=UPI00341E5C19